MSDAKIPGVSPVAVGLEFLGGLIPQEEDGLVVDTGIRQCPVGGLHAHTGLAGDDTGHHNPVMCPSGNLLLPF